MQKKYRNQLRVKEWTIILESSQAASKYGDPIICQNRLKTKTSQKR